MTIYGYTRVSTSEQAANGDSLETQQKILMGYAQSKGEELTPDNIFVEAGVSGSSEFKKRPEGSKLYDLLQHGDMLIVPKIDRGFRNIRDALNTLHDLKERGVSVHFIDLGGDATCNGISQILFTILGAFADFERSRIAQRISEVKQVQKSKGIYVGGVPPFGYLIEEGRLIPDPSKTVVLERMVELRRELVSYRRIGLAIQKEFKIELNRQTVMNILRRSPLSSDVNSGF